MPWQNAISRESPLQWGKRLARRESRSRSVSPFNIHVSLPLTHTTAEVCLAGSHRQQREPSEGLTRRTARRNPQPHLSTVSLGAWQHSGQREGIHFGARPSALLQEDQRRSTVDISQGEHLSDQAQEPSRREQLASLAVDSRYGDTQVGTFGAGRQTVVGESESVDEAISLR